MTRLTRFKFFLWYFGHFKVPLIGALKPHILTLDEQHIVIKLRLSRKSKNHLNAMYFGALAIGADIAGGLHGFYHAKQTGKTISLVFKSFKADFLRRPESDVYFVSSMGMKVAQMIKQSDSTGERVNQCIHVAAYVKEKDLKIEVAQFVLELSLKVIH